MATAQAYYDNRSVAEVAREDEYSRNIKRAQATQQKKQKERVHMQQVSQNINTSKQNISQAEPQTDAQKKQALKKQQKNYFQKSRARRKTNAKKKILMKLYAKDIKRYENTPWILMYTAVGVNIFGGLLTALGGIGYLFVIPATLFIDVMIWKAFSKKDRVEISALMVVASVIKFIPIIGMLPASWRLVYVAEKKAREKMEESEKKIKKLSVR